jgi:hypothetical protein
MKGPNDAVSVPFTSAVDRPKRPPWPGTAAPRESASQMRSPEWKSQRPHQRARLRTICPQGRVQRANFDLSRGRNIGPRAHVGVIAEGGKGPSGLSWHGCQTAERARKPKANAAFVGKRCLRR